jgi:hypothetical protein
MHAGPNSGWVVGMASSRPTNPPSLPPHFVLGRQIFGPSRGLDAKTEDASPKLMSRGGCVAARARTGRQRESWGAARGAGLQSDERLTSSYDGLDRFVSFEIAKGRPVGAAFMQGPIAFGWCCWNGS